MNRKRKYSVGAEIQGKGVHFRLWTPEYKNVTLHIKSEAPAIYPMERENNGYFSLFVPKIKAGTLYQFELNQSGKLLSDPASRFQPEGPDGPSCVIDPQFSWTDSAWKGIQREGQVLYEMHIGTFTEEGTFASAQNELENLVDLGITAIEIMPLNDFPGNFGWGYDGINLFAPTRLYGTPIDVKNFINRAHHLGLGVILDVVYNHFGPEFDQFAAFSKHFLHRKKMTNWGTAINFDNPYVREFFLANVHYWIHEYHFDGIRVDATDCFYSNTKRHILADIVKTAKEAASQKKILVIGENEQQKVKLLHEERQGGYGFDALWNDDFHHTARVRLTGKREAYFFDYLGSPQEFISALKYGYLYQGQYYSWQKKLRGTQDLHLNPESLIIFLENHDQIANTILGRRIHQISHPGDYKALTSLLLLSPNIPMLFQGQEFGSSRPFLYFSQHSKGLNQKILRGREQHLEQFQRFKSSNNSSMPSPSDFETFAKCKLDFQERRKNKFLYQLHKDLIKLRKSTTSNLVKIDGAVLNRDCFLIRFCRENYDDRLLLINLGNDFELSPIPEPLFAPPIGKKWKLLWSSEDLKYGGEGTSRWETHIKILGHSSLLLKV